MPNDKDVKPLVDHAVVKFGKIYSNVSVYDEEDLRQEIHTALLVAAASYDSSKGPWFYYASKVISNTVAEIFRKNDILSKSYRKTANEIKDFEEKYIALYGKKPSISEISRALNISTTKINEISKRELFKKQHDIIHNDYPDPTVVENDEILIIKSEHERIKKCFSKLPAKYQKVLMLRTINNVPVEMVAKTMGVTKGRISQLHKEALLSLKDMYEENN